MMRFSFSRIKSIHTYSTRVEPALVKIMFLDFVEAAGLLICLVNALALRRIVSQIVLGLLLTLTVDDFAVVEGPNKRANDSIL